MPFESGYTPVEISDIEIPTLRDLASSDEMRRLMAAHNMPQALSQDAVGEVSQKIHILFSRGEAGYDARRSAERRAVVSLGRNAMEHSDLVTAQNTVDHLKSEKLMWRPSAISLALSVRKAKKSILSSITSQ